MTMLRRAGWLLAGMVAMLLVAEALLRLLPVPHGLNAADASPAWPVHRIAPNADFTSSEGWDFANVQHGHINDMGYVAPFDYRPGAGVGVVLGDSFVEGSMNPYDAMLQAQLARRLNMPGNAVYNFGTAGASLPHYLGLARLASARYRPRWAVVAIVSNDFVEGFRTMPGYYSWDRAPGLVRLTPDVTRRGAVVTLRSLALFRYVRLGLKAEPRLLLASGFQNAPRPACRTDALSADDRRLAEGWVAALPAALHLPADRVVLVFDSNRQAIAAGRSPVPACPGRDDLALALLRRRAGDAGIGVVDTGPLFAAGWARSPALDRWPVDGRWTPYAHALVADRVAERLRAVADR